MNKFRNQPVEIDGIKFASKKEAKRYCELRLLQKAGEISHLELQPRFKLYSGTTPVKYDSGRQATYVADFAYFDAKQNKRVVEDAKGFRTDTYKLKKALVEANYPAVKIVEI